jgi:hypothetical protein
MMVGAATLVLLGVGLPSARASDMLPLECLANGTAVAQPNPDGTAIWKIDGSGTCQGDFTGTYTMTLHGRGTSTGLSQCSGTLVTQNLNLAVQVEITNFDGTRMSEQSWSLPVDNYSVRTPFVIGGAANGAGYIGHNIFLACPGSGTPAASYAFSFFG